MQPVHLSQFIAAIEKSSLSRWATLLPWQLTAQSDQIVRRMLADLDPSQFRIENEVAIHVTSVVEQGVILKGPVIISADVFIGAHAYLRGGNWIDVNCSIGPGCELKSSFLFAESRLAHFNFIGDSIIGRDVNLEAGSVICNHRNERVDKDIAVRVDGDLVSTGITKFGAVVGDGSRLGANSVVAPGGLLQPGTLVGRGTVWDQEAGQA
ncbi:hypothetical protein [Herbaspirillum rubrisubalbicans]|uniref:LpxA family transferase n=1 Tax=Herbaspirillum rubrisubalbicans TaxID=80842 RepID=A0AAD0XJJ8_9BURK|nr:hypothetical protein [Herbaspirillum rubrisubalbicans]AYR26705.1 LpxA family transferase [Herbaspirillum rubrisubalbicans]